MVSELSKYLFLYSLRVNSTNRNGYIAEQRINYNWKMIGADMPGNKFYFGYNSYFTSSLKGDSVFIPLALINKTN